MGEISALTHYSKASMKSVVDSETSMETILLKFKKDKKRHFNASFNTTPVPATLSAKKRAQNEKFKAEQDEAMKLYERKLKE